VRTKYFRQSSNRVFIRQIYIYTELVYIYIHRKNDFAEISKNLAKYKSGNNFVGLSK